MLSVFSYYGNLKYLKDAGINEANPINVRSNYPIISLNKHHYSPPSHSHQASDAGILQTSTSQTTLIGQRKA